MKNNTTRKRSTYLTIWNAVGAHLLCLYTVDVLRKSWEPTSGSLDRLGDQHLVY